MTAKAVILDLTSEDEADELVGQAGEALSAVVGVRSELAAGDLRPLYLARLPGCAVCDRDENAFCDDSHGSQPGDLASRYSRRSRPRAGLCTR